MTTPESLSPLPSTVYSLFYEAPEDDFGDSYQEFIDAPGYTADQMRAYAAAAVEAALSSRPVADSIPAAYISPEDLAALHCIGAKTLKLVTYKPDGSEDVPLYLHAAQPAQAEALEPVAYRIDYPGLTDTIGLRRFCGADEYQSFRPTIEFLGGVFVPLYTQAPTAVPEDVRDLLRRYVQQDIESGTTDNNLFRSAQAALSAEKGGV